jgi:hypothetical protein
VVVVVAAMALLLVWAQRGLETPAGIPVEEVAGPLAPQAAGRWSAADLPPAPVQPPEDHVGAWTGRRLVVFGAGAQAVAFHPDTQDWRRLPDHLLGTAPQTAVWTGRELLVWGSQDRRLRGMRYNFERERWEALHAGPLPAMQVVVSAWTGSRVLVWGVTPSGLKASAEYIPEDDRWQDFPPGPLWNVSDIAGAWAGDRLVLWGERNGSRSGTETFAAAFDPDQALWRQLDPPPFSGRAGAPAGVRIGGRVLIWDDAGGGAALRVGERAWRPVTLPHLGREAAVLAWTGTELLVWGGSTSRGPTVDLVAWRPTTNP